MGYINCVATYFNVDINIVDIALDLDIKVFVFETYLEKNIYDSNFTHNQVMFIMGNERSGVSNYVLDLLEAGYLEPVYIKGCYENSSDNSLNISIASVIAAYERNRQYPCDSKRKCDKK